MKTRQEEHREQTEAEIKALAWQLMEEQGPADLSLREISRQMRFSPLSASPTARDAHRHVLFNCGGEGYFDYFRYFARKVY